MFSSFDGPTADHVWQQMARALRDGRGVRMQPSKGGATKEILHAAISISDPKQRWVVSRHPPLNVAFAIAEVVWIMTGRNDLAFLEAWNSRLREFVGPGPQLHGAYGHQLRHYLGFDQLTRASDALRCNPDTRQVALQIWDSSVDLPLSDGEPADPDIPCNVLSLLKVRDGKLEWLQVIRSNDLFLGVPHNFVQFTCLQEIVAGWLGIDCGAYQQVSDSLHVYDRDEANMLASEPLADVPLNTDSLALSQESSERAFVELGRRVERMIGPGLGREELERIATWSEGPEAIRNMLSILVAEAARKQKWPDISEEAMATCTNPVYQELWRRWLTRFRAPRSSEADLSEGFTSYA